MHIHGVGIISPAGRGLDVHRAALKGGELPVAADGFLRVQEKDLKDPRLAKDARRADRFDRMAILAGLDAFQDAGLGTDVDLSRVGLILATGLGPHATTFRFLDDMINFREKDVSPTLFSHSVHNAAASYISLLAGLRGPTITITRFSHAFEEGLMLARAWLEQQRCDYVLLGAVDELGVVMEKVLRLKSSGGDVPFREGGAFFVLSQKPAARGYASVAVIKGRIQGALSGQHPCQDVFDFATAVLSDD
ncbi:MAG: beta-ketoacyl synthase N-terminal-like domain-containing protein [Candidatus Omnitrophota bacterium]